MTPETHDEVRAALAKAVEAMRQKNKAEAFSWASRAARLAPGLEEPWLIMAAVSHPQASLQYLNRAIQINPQSQKARQGIIWATKRLQTISAAGETIRLQTIPVRPQTSQSVENTRQILPKQQLVPSKPKTKWMPILLFWVGLFVVFCISSVTVSAFAGSWMLSRRVNSTLQPAQVSVKFYQPPTATAPLPPSPTPTQIPTPTPTSLPTLTPTLPPLPTPIIPTAVPVVPAIPVTPLPTQPAPVPQYDTPSQYVPGGGERWIDVNLSQQKLYAFEGNKVVNSFLMSSGVAAHPTVTGQYHIYVKYRFDDMRGPGYFLPNVPYVMYFFDGYGIHGTYWHHNFGHPMSHGCLNLSIPDSAWMYGWASEGTLVNIHY